MALDKGGEPYSSKVGGVNVSGQLDSAERDELEEIMERRYPDGPLQASCTRLAGFLTAVVSGPMVLPSEWTPIVFGASDAEPWDSMAEAQNAMGLLMRYYNEAASKVGPGGECAIIIDRIGTEPDAIDLATDWCRGYLLGIDLRGAEWQEAISAPEIAGSFPPIFNGAAVDGIDPRDPEYQLLMDALPTCVAEIAAWWRTKLLASMAAGRPQGRSATFRRAAPKISPNAPCPCGSGKKYKRCCAPA